MKNRFLALSVLVFTTAGIFLVLPGLAQNPADPLLSADEAVRIALEANYDIQISQADAGIARLNNTRGNAGMLPTINLVANENLTLSAFKQKLATELSIRSLVRLLITPMQGYSSPGPFSTGAECRSPKKGWKSWKLLVKSTCRIPYS